MKTCSALYCNEQAMWLGRQPTGQKVHACIEHKQLWSHCGMTWEELPSHKALTFWRKINDSRNDSGDV